VPNFTAGTSFTDGVTNDVTAAKLNALVADAVPTSSLALASTTGTISNFTASTANITLGTIPNLTAGTTTSTAATITNGTITNGTITTALIPTLTAGTTTGTAGIFTSGTIATLNSTTGTIATFNSTTGTIPTLVATTLITTGTGTAAAPAIVPTGDTNTGIFFPAADTIAFSEGGAEAMRIDSSGNVGIGTNSASYRLEVKGPSATAGQLSIRDGNGDTVISGSIAGSLLFQARDSAVRTIAQIDAVNTTINGTGAEMVFQTRISDVLAERLRIDSSGNLLVGKTTTGVDVAGGYVEQAGRARFTTNNTLEVLTLNRQDNDGTIVEIRQANTAEGTISVSGTTVSYNGGHLSRWSQLLSGQRDASIKKGTVMSNLNEMCEWFDKDGNLLPNEQLNKVKVSDIEGESNVAGVFVNWDDDDKDNPFDLNMAMTGDMIIRIAQGTSVNRGDLLMSAGDGTAKPQGDDIIRSKTIAKVTSTNVTFTYEDGSYCVPCVLMAC